MDRIDRLRVFVRVVECASFTRAADTLGLPRSSVSGAIRELESRIGTRLLHRTTRQVTLTYDGSAFYERCQRLLADFDDTESLFREASVQPSGRLKVDVPGRIGRLVVVPALPGFLQLYPELEVELCMADRTVDLVADRVDCALRVGALADSGLVARSLGVLTLVNVASPAYLERHGSPLSADDLDRHFAIGYASPSTGRLEGWEWVEGSSVRTMPMRSRVIVNSAEAYLACCLAGLGLIQIPEYDVRQHLASGELVEVMPALRAVPMPISLVYAHRQHLSRRLQVFVDWLSDLVRRKILLQSGE